MRVQRRFSYAAGAYVRGQTYKFYAYASNVDGEGPPSAPVTFTAPSSCVGTEGLHVHGCMVVSLRQNSWNQP